MRYLVLAITGKALSGKSTAKDMIREIVAERYGGQYRVVPLSFASKLKEIATEVFGWNGDKGFHYKTASNYLNLEEMPKEPEKRLIQDAGRQLLINLGEKIREIRPTVWADYELKKVDRDITEGKAENSIYIIDDMRLKEELRATMKFGSKFKKIRILRDDSLKSDSKTETDLDDITDWDQVITNNGTKEEYRQKLKEIVEFILDTSLRHAKPSI